MKIKALLVLGGLASFNASADVVLGGDVEINAWQQNYSNNEKSVNGQEMNLAMEASIEHFIPFIPNFKIAQSNVKNDDFSYSKRDFTLYYEILDNDLISLDAGVGYTQLSSGNLMGNKLSGGYPHLYAAAEIGIPETPLFVFAKGNGLVIKGQSAIDAQVGVQYEIGMGVVDLELQAGYRIQKFDVSKKYIFGTNLNTKVDGAFAGVNIDF